MIDQQSGHQIIGTHFAFWLPQSPARFLSSLFLSLSLPFALSFALSSLSLSVLFSSHSNIHSSIFPYPQPPLRFLFFLIPFLSLGLSLSVQLRFVVRRRLTTHPLPPSSHFFPPQQHPTPSVTTLLHLPYFFHPVEFLNDLRLIINPSGLPEFPDGFFLASSEPKRSRPLATWPSSHPQPFVHQSLPDHNRG